ncbi:MAG: leucine--tRNA ligase, partial [Candidatus Altiarchaeota archaeon]|nr:leucine--tRNA ligase [Candidatus Altiarchaeota archaeon]
MKWKSYETKWQERWQKSGTFVPKTDPSLKKFFLTIPYPYTSGALHIGHGRTYTLGDVIARFKRHQGFNVLFPMAFHISGSPILSISDKIKKEHTKTLSLYREYLNIYEKDERKAEQILNSFKDPEKVANYFADKIQLDFQSIGYSIDWTRKFTTGQPRYNKFVEWQFTKLKERGVLVKGKHPILWSVDDGQPVGEDDIVDGDIDKVSISEFSALKFESDFGLFIASTLRPETVFGITNIWLNPEKYYVVADVGKERWVLSEKAAEKMKLQGDSVKIIKREKGKYFIGGKVKTPLGETVPILPADFVEVENATGVVSSVPAHAPYDYIGLVDLKHHEKWGPVVQKIEPIVIVDIPGYQIPAKEICEQMSIRNQKDSRIDIASKEIYKSEFYTGVLNSKCKQFSGIPIHTIKDKVKDWLVKEKKLTSFYETSRVATTRSGGKVAVAVLDNQWFIDYSDSAWKKQTVKHLKKMLIFPDKFRKLFLDTVEWLDKRPCARKRGLGTRFPFDKDWIIESLSDSTIYMAFYTVIPHLQKITPEKLTPEVFDFLLLGKGKASKIAEKTGISEALVKKARADFEYWYPNDQRHTAPAHISNHLTFFIMHHLAIFPESDWPQGISLNDMLVREGAKMSKSKGNIIPLNNVREKYG